MRNTTVAENEPQTFKKSVVLENNPHTNQLVWVTFDPRSREHMAAFLCVAKYGRQHPVLRFHLEKPFINVKVMMEAKIADAYVALFNELGDELDNDVLRMLGKPVAITAPVATKAMRLHAKAVPA